MIKKKKKPSHKHTSTNGNAEQKMTSEKLAAKKAAVLGKEKKGRMPLIAAVICGVMVAAGAFFYFSGSGSQVSAIATQTSSGASQITYQVALFDDGKARHYAFNDGDMTIKYFILKSSDGVIRAAFDACDVCWSAGKGYFQEGDNMVCRNCGRRFASVLVNEVKGGCNPAPLNRRIDEDKLVLDVADIREGRQYFNFSGKV